MRIGTVYYCNECGNEYVDEDEGCPSCDGRQRMEDESGIVELGEDDFQPLDFNEEDIEDDELYEPDFWDVPLEEEDE